MVTLWAVRRSLSMLTSVAVAASLAADPVLAAKPRSSRANPRTGRLAPALTELVKAAKRNDQAAMGRVADRLGPARLGDAIASTAPGVGQAALAAVPLARGGVRLLAAVSNELGAADNTRASAAATALGRLLDASVPTELEDWDVPPDVIARACSGLPVLAWRAGAPISVRLAALDAIATASPTCGVPTEIMGLARDPSPAIRRAVVLLGATADWRDTALRDAIADADRTVSAAGTAAACRVEGRAGRGGKTEAPGSTALASARTLAATPATPSEDAVEMLDCLAGANGEDRALLDQLQRRPPSSLRDRAVELGDPRAKPQ